MTQEEVLDMLYNLSVKMRGDLDSIYSASIRLANKQARELDPKLDATAAVLDSSFYRLLSLTENLSDSKYLSSQQPLSSQVTNLVSFVGDICAKSQSAMGDTAKKITFHCPVATLPWAINRQGLERALYHLLCNALKYSPDDGTISVHLSQQKQQLELKVCDHGCGMTPQQITQALTIPKAIDKYSNINGGFGLGLPITQAIVNRHGGTLSIESHQNRGTTITINLPPWDKTTVGLSDISPKYVPIGGFNPTLVRLADALPSKAFTIRNQD